MFAGSVHPLSASLIISVGEGGGLEPANWLLKPCGELGILHRMLPDVTAFSCLPVLWRHSWENGRTYQSLFPCLRLSDQFCPVPCLGWRSQGRGGEAPAVCVCCSRAEGNKHLSALRAGAGWNERVQRDRSLRTHRCHCRDATALGCLPEEGFFSL